MYMCMDVHIHASMDVCISNYICIWMDVCMHLCMCIRTYFEVCMYYFCIFCVAGQKSVVHNKEGGKEVSRHVFLRFQLHA